MTYCAKVPSDANNRLLGLSWAIVVFCIGILLLRIFSDRAAFVHLGAIIGTVMVANVFFVIIPNQRKSVDAMLAGLTPDPDLGLKAKQRSLHNNYMTLPVLFLMISTHYPIVFGHHLNWLILTMLALAGISVRHFFNLKHRGLIIPTYLVVGSILFVAAIGVAAVPAASQRTLSSSSSEISEAHIDSIVTKHCSNCHSNIPTHESFDGPPMGVVLETAKDALAVSDRVIEHAIRTDSMPLGNETGMQQSERDLLGIWLTQNELSQLREPNP